MNFKFLTDQRAEFNTPHIHVSTQHRERLVRNPEFFAEGPENFFREKRDLSFVIGFIIEKPIPSNSRVGDAVELFDLDHRVIPGSFAMMAEIIMTGRSIELQQLHNINFA